MKTYKVRLESITRATATIEIEAESRAAAENLAMASSNAGDVTYHLLDECEVQVEEVEEIDG